LSNGEKVYAAKESVLPFYTSHRYTNDNGSSDGGNDSDGRVNVRDEQFSTIFDDMLIKDIIVSC